MGERRSTEDHRDDAGDSRVESGTTRAPTDGWRADSGAGGLNAAANGKHRQAADASGGTNVPGEIDSAADGDEGLALGEAVERAVDRVTTEEAWSPPPEVDDDIRPVRRALRPDESLQLAAPGELLGVDGGPATAALTDDRLVVAAEDGLVSVGFDRLCAVRSSIDAAVGLRGRDARVLGAVGYALSVVAFLGVLGVASNPLTPALALATVGGALAFAHVCREGVGPGERSITDRLRRYDAIGALADRLAGIERRVRGSASDDPVALWTTGALAVVPFAVIVALETGLLAPLFALATAASFALVVRAVRDSDEFDGLEVVRTRRRTVVATVDDGSSVAVRTRPDSPLDRELAACVGGNAGRSPDAGGD